MASERHLLHKADVYEGDGVNYVFTVVVWKEDDEFYSSRLHTKTYDLQLLTGMAIPKQEIFGRWHSGLTVATNPLSSDVFVKGPQVLYYGQDDTNLGKELLREAELCEILGRNPHPNVCAYYGVVREGEYITGLCFRRYECTLQEAVRSGVKFNRHTIMCDITAAVHFLHSIGFVHNDLNPTNVMLDKEGHGVLIDFDSCREEGQALMKGGTVDWSRDSDTSERENDFYSMSLLARFLSEEYDPWADWISLEASGDQLCIDTISPTA